MDSETLESERDKSNAEIINEDGNDLPQMDEKRDDETESPMSTTNVNEELEPLQNNDSDPEFMSRWVKSRIEMNGIALNLTDVDEKAINDFIANPYVCRLFIFVGEHGDFHAFSSESSFCQETNPDIIQISAGRVMEKIHQYGAKEFMYFVKPYDKSLQSSNINKIIQYGKINYRGNGIRSMGSLLRAMNGVFATQLRENTSWPDSVKKDLILNLHKFVASLTETTNNLKGKTALFIPLEDLEHPEQAAMDKDVVQRLESTMIRWTRQIKELVSNQEMASNTETSGLLEEIEFWKSRTADLSGISEQLKNEEVKKIVFVLEYAKSSYLKPFQNIADMIQKGSYEANDNLKYLMLLSEPCSKIDTADSKGMLELLPEILNRIRLICFSSGFYNTEERIVGLLRKVSYEIIRRGSSCIHLHEIYDGNIDVAIHQLTESIEMGVFWKELYKRTTAAIEKYTDDPTKHWNFDQRSIFAQVDAFVQRCRDLLEICEGQIQFARRNHEVCKVPNSKVTRAPLPLFSGTRGEQISESLKDIEDQFEKYITNLKCLDYDVLDVKSTRWHEDYNHLKTGMKDLEAMTQNIINGAFEGVASVRSAVELLVQFSYLAHRDSIVRCVTRKTSEMYLLMQRQIDLVRAEFDQNRHAPPIGPLEPKYGSAARWALGLLRRVQQDWRLISDAKRFFRHTREEHDVKTSYESLIGALEAFAQKMHQDWISQTHLFSAEELRELLQTPLMLKLPNGNLASNLDKSLVSMFEEVDCWESIDEFEIPQSLVEAATTGESLMELREYVMLVVRDYNAIMRELNAEEHELFHAQIKRLDSRIEPGLANLTWASEGVVDRFVRECRKYCSETHAIVLAYKRDKDILTQECSQVAEICLIKLNKNTVYESAVFISRQGDHLRMMRARLEQTHSKVTAILDDIYTTFRDDPDAIQQQWQKFVGGIDKMLGNALRQMVKRSLQELSRAISGDNKTEPQALFRVNIVLEHNEVQFKPTMTDLTRIINILCKDIVGSTKLVPRVLRHDIRAEMDTPDSVTSLEKIRQSYGYYDAISNNEDILKVLVQIMGGISSCASELEKYLEYWDKYRPLWELDKDSFIRRYAKANQPLDQFLVDIMKYREQQNEIQSEDITCTINFIKTDCSLLKTSLVSHVNAWQSKLTDLLHKTAANELQELFDMMEKTSANLSTKPLNLDELSEKIHLRAKFVSQQSEIEAKFEPLRKKFEALVKFDIKVPESQVTQLQTLDNTWEDFGILLETSEGSLQTAKLNMKHGLEDALKNYNNQVEEFRKEVTKILPYDGDHEIDEAFALLDDYTNKMGVVCEKRDRLRPGLSIFDIEVPASIELNWTESEIQVLREIWEVSREWRDKWAAWKDNTFADLVIGEMETSSQVFNKTLGKLARGNGFEGAVGGAKKLGAFVALKERIDQFRQTLPLIQDLKNPAIRERHWHALMDEIEKRFDPYSNTFTLATVFSLGLHMHGEFISETSSNANKELAIEQSLSEIEQVWKDINIDLTEYKSVYKKIRSTEDIFTQLEDNQVSLSTMKASKFFVTFKTRIEAWEGNLSSVGEVIELLLQVQRQWMYLESIFMASEDIQRQLPTEAKLFSEVNTAYVKEMNEIVANSNAVKVCTQPGVLERLQEMDAKLEKIQKSLDNYLENKRQCFPRFYFLSNDDLLEILGQQKDPSQVQKHIRKCFVGIKVLDLVEPGKQDNATYIAKAMISNDGEEVPLSRTVIIDGAVEGWLNDVEACMFETIAQQCGLTLQAYRGKKEKWIKNWPGQLLITVGAIAWTQECTNALELMMKGSNKNALKQAKKKQVSYLNKLADMVRGQLTRIEREKLVALITMEIHNRDVQERMLKSNCQSVSDFDWLSQLRFYWNKDEGPYGGIMVRQTNQQMEYGYEYQGNNGRLVVTPLTDRCVLTLVTALALNRGGAPAGPAGTGKTETVKDLGKNLAKYVVVFNCSDSMDYKSVGRMFSGLVQTGGWGCFDEFNRIQIEVLSVIAQQVMSIMTAIAQKKHSFNFMGVEVRCRWSCGIFITMNPGYAGRTELPDNLKSLFRPVSMMVPDLALIAEVMLAAEGFKEAKPLAKKTTTLYALMIQQLSKQDHYDFGLRSLRGVLMCAGALKRADASVSEELILLRALRDMNVPKFIREDMELFMLLINDLFPGMETPPSEQGELLVAMKQSLTDAGLQQHDIILSKSIQLYESKLTRHCNMVVGRTLSGKSVGWKCLANATTLMSKSTPNEFHPVREYCLNPKSISMDELYGAFDLSTMEWTDGILSNIFRQCAQDERSDEKWIVLDGPVDTLWIESMNTVMDDNKTLTLINGDRIGMSSSMSLLFEVRDLSVASPATVSRAGMIYFDVDDLGYEPFSISWIQRRLQRENAAANVDSGSVPGSGVASNSERSKLYTNLFAKYCKPLLAFKSRTVTELVPVTDFNAIISLCNLFDSLATPENGVCPHSNAATYNAMAEKWFVFASVWSIGAAADTAGRKRFDEFIRTLEAQFPPAETVYDYFIDVTSKDWKLWNEKVPNPWKPQKGIDFFKINVPTVDTVRNTFVTDTLVRNKFATLLVGETGTGKTVLVEQLLEQYTAGESSRHSKLVVNFSSATNSLATQEIIEGVLEKRSKDKFGPPGGKQMICFVDDFNMPRKDLFGSQPPLELLRQWVDYGGWYDRAKQSWKYIMDIQLLVAMGPPGGGRSVISERLQSRFNLINFTPPQTKDMERIFSSILVPKFQEFDDDMKGLGEIFSRATVRLYADVSKSFLPTPAKCHYLFNLRDIAKVVQGLLLADKAFIDTRETALRLWCHEAMRVFADRFIEYGDINAFRQLVNEQLSAQFSSSWKDLMDSCENPDNGPIFCDFLSEPVGSSDDAKAPYEEVLDMQKLKVFLEEKLEDYNMEPGFLPMDLVLFRDAIGHVCRTKRVIQQPRGNCMLVGVGGSGRQSLARLASYVAEQKVFQIEITKQYGLNEFHEDLKSLYLLTGGEGKEVTFIFSDTQIKEEAFLEDINNILSSGEVPNLFPKDEKMGVFEAVRPHAKKNGILETADKLWEFFIQRVRSNLHIVLAMSPVGEGFRNRCRMYPALVNCTTIDFFHPWPAEALTEVASKFLQETNIGHGDNESTLKRAVGEVFACAHESVATASNKMLLELKRHNYVTPTNYLELVKSYRELVQEKLSEIGENRTKLSSGLSKLEEGKEQVETLSVELEAKKITVAQAQKECEELLVVIVSERSIADERKKQVEAQAEKIMKEEVECKAIAADAEADLAKALPALEAAMLEVDKLDKGSISEVKAYASPPAAVEMVLNAVMLLFQMKPDWATAKKKISEPNFLSQIKSFDKDNVPLKVTSKLKSYTDREDFTPEFVRSKSGAAAALCVWVLAIELYSNVAREVQPKRDKLKTAMSQLATAQASLKAAQEELAIVIQKVEELNEKYTTSVNHKNALRDEAESLENKLDRADKLVSGLSGERVRWEASIATFDTLMHNVVGDALVAAAFLSYAGPFDTTYREQLVKVWLQKTRELNVPVSPEFNFADFLSKPTDVRNWNLAGLPADNFSIENGVITTRGRRWPLMIDPQGQANKWIKNAHKNLTVCTLNMPDFVRKLETALQFGSPYLLQDVEEELDPAIEPVLTKSIVKVGNRKIIKLGDKEIDYSDDFKFFITTKLGNPHYTPEVSTKVTLVNFAVKLQGLEAQLLGEVVRQEEPQLEKQKAELVVKVAQGKNALVELENTILKSLAECKGSLLDDEALVDTLAISKRTSEEVTQQLAIAQETEIQIDATRQGYREVSTRAAILYFVLDDMSRVDPMYQFSLGSYNDLFVQSIIRSRKSVVEDDGDNGENSELQRRIKQINDFHTYAVYAYACRGLFERHKLLFSLQICFKKMQNDNLIARDELDFFLRGSNMVDRSDQKPNPLKDVLDAGQWDSITQLDGFGAFNGIASSFEQNKREWTKWILSPNPEVDTLPDEWDTKLTELQRMLIVRATRLDRTLNVCSNFVANNLGAEFVEPPPFDLKAVFESSSPSIPLIFVLSPGVDPTKQVYTLAEQVGRQVSDCSLGQGQAPIATRLIREGLKDGNWVFLANCHLAASWLPTLEKIIDDYCEAKSFHPNFRLWLSSSPTPKFPLAILQRGMKMTTEPPKGLKANMLRLYNLVPEDQFERCEQSSKYKKLLFCLSWFHSLLLERRKFLALGWNIPYDFNDADFLICENILAMYLDEYPTETPWDAIRYLIAQANYGGRITDDWDRRLCNAYVEKLFCEDAINIENFRITELDSYFIPSEGALKSYKEYIGTLPLDDDPACFGQHPNADISSMMTNSKDTLDTLVSLQPRVVSMEGQSDDDKVLIITKDLQTKIPGPIDAYEAKKTMQSRSDPAPLKSVLLQEIDRYNILLNSIRGCLVSLESGIKGTTLITAELEEVFNALLVGRVPGAWGKSYPSLKPLGSWVRDLIARIAFMTDWLKTGLPKAFWLSAFTYPTGFLTGILQTTARKNALSIDSLSWEFPVQTTGIKDIPQQPKEGAYMYGMVLEGAKWNFGDNCLADANPMELYAEMPVVHFKPVEKAKKQTKSVYVCPLYLYPVRTGTRERPSFVVGIHLDSGAVDASYWVFRGTALLLGTEK